MPATALAGKTVKWNFDEPPIVPDWVPQAVTDQFDKDWDGIHDDFEESVADNFAPQYRFDSGELYRRKNVTGCHDDPVLLHAITADGFVSGGAVKLRARYIELFVEDGDTTYCDTGFCLPYYGHDGDSMSHDFEVHLFLDTSGWTSEWIQSSSGYIPWPGSDGRPVIFPSRQKHHHHASPYWQSCLSGTGDPCGEVALGDGDQVTPSTFGALVDSFCTGGSYVEGECIVFNQTSVVTPRGTLNALAASPFCYANEFVYLPEPFAGGLGNRDSGVASIVGLLHGSAPTGLRLTMGGLFGEQCRPVAVGSSEALADADNDTIPDACDPCVDDPDQLDLVHGYFPVPHDTDDDGVPDVCDPCAFGHNELNANLDGEDALISLNKPVDNTPDGCDPHASSRITSVGTGYFADTANGKSGVIDFYVQNNQAPPQGQEGNDLGGSLTSRRCFCANGGGPVGLQNCNVRDVPPGVADPLTQVCIKNGLPASTADFQSGLGWLPMRSYRKRMVPAWEAPNFDSELCVARAAAGFSPEESCERSILTYGPLSHALDDRWERHPRLAWDTWAEIEDREIYNHTRVPAIPSAVQKPLPPLPPGQLVINAPAENDVVADPAHYNCLFDPQGCPPQPQCYNYWDGPFLVTVCVNAEIPFGVDGWAALWTRVHDVDFEGPSYDAGSDPTWRRIHDSYSEEFDYEFDGRRVTQWESLFAYPAEWFLIMPGLPPDPFGQPSVEALGGSAVLMCDPPPCNLGLWGFGDPNPHPAVFQSLGPAAETVENAAAFTVANMNASGGPSDPLSGLTMLAFDATTGLLHTIENGPDGYQVTSSLDTGVVASQAKLGVAENGFALLATSSSPWEFFLIDPERTAALPIRLPGAWQGSLAIWPRASSFRVVGVLSGGMRGPQVGVAEVQSDGTAALVSLPDVPVRDGLWFGRALDHPSTIPHGGEAREYLLVGGGIDSDQIAHSDVYAMDLGPGGQMTLAAPDDLLAAGEIGSDVWLQGFRAAEGWQLRAVPRPPADPEAFRHSSYERFTGIHDGWRGSGFSTLTSRRPDVTFADRVQRGSTCELIERPSAPWYAPPGRWVFNQALEGDNALLCDQPIPSSVSVSQVPRAVIGYALVGPDLWTTSTTGSLERWNLSSGSPVLVQALDSSLAAFVAASGSVAAIAEGFSIELFRRGRDGFTAVGSLELCDDVVALVARGNEVIAIGSAHVTRIRVAASSAHIDEVFELATLDETVVAHVLDPETCGGAEAPERIVSGHAFNHVLLLGLEHALAAFDLRRGGALPTLGSMAMEQGVYRVATDGNFLYAYTPAPLVWHSFRLGPNGPFTPAGNGPARAFAQGRQYAGRYAAQLTSSTLQVAVW